VRELGDAFDRYNIPSLNELFNTTFDSLLEWDAISSFQKSPLQSEESFKVCYNNLRQCNQISY